MECTVGCGENSAAALPWLTRAANQIYAPAMVQLGDYLATGLGGTAVNATRAAALYLAASAAGEPLAMYRAGETYRDGLGGTVPNVTAAWVWFKLAEVHHSDIVVVSRQSIRAARRALPCNDTCQAQAQDEVDNWAPVTEACRLLLQPALTTRALFCDGNGRAVTVATNNPPYTECQCMCDEDYYLVADRCVSGENTVTTTVTTTTVTTATTTTTLTTTSTTTNVASLAECDVNSTSRQLIASAVTNWLALGAAVPTGRMALHRNHHRSVVLCGQRCTASPEERCVGFEISTLRGPDSGIWRTCADKGGQCACTGTVVMGHKFVTVNGTTSLANVTQLMASAHLEIRSNTAMRCSYSHFGSNAEPLPHGNQVCMCNPAVTYSRTCQL